jgi:hypothetical protein
MMQAGREDWGVARRLCMKLREPVINGDDLFGDPDPPGLPDPVLVVAGCSLLWLSFRQRRLHKRLRRKCREASAARAASTGR